MNNAQLTQALDSLTKRVDAIEQFEALINPEKFAEMIVEFLEGRFPNGALVAALTGDGVDMTLPETVEIDPLAVGDRVRVTGGDWGNSFGVIVNFLRDGQTSIVEDASHATIDLESHLQDAVIELELLEFVSRPEVQESSGE